MSDFLFNKGDLITTKHGDSLLIIDCIRKKYSLNSYKKNGYIYKCQSCGYVGDMQESNVKSGCGCVVCHGRRKTYIGINDLWTTNIEVANLLLNKKDGFNYSKGSGKKLWFVCPECGFRKRDVVSLVTRRGLSCPMCSDGISYPNKFMFSLLTFMGIEFENEKTIKDKYNCKNHYRYDFYIQSLNMIIEMHGKQHYRDVGKSWGSLEDVRKNDEKKESIAMENGIKYYIVVDSSKSELSFIKRSILNSLGDFFDFSKVNWDECDKNATKSIVKKICDVWKINKTYTTTDISKELGICVSTVEKYLKIGNKLGMCEYDKEKSFSRSHIKTTKKVKCLDTGEIFDNVNVAAQKYNTNPNTIRGCCHGRKKHAGSLNGVSLCWEYM